MGKKQQTQTGRAPSKTAERHSRKNDEVVDDFLLFAKAASDADTLARSLGVEAFELAKVIAPRGGGRVEVTKSDGVTENVRIAGAIKFHGKAGNKTERPNCLYAGSHVILRGGDAAGRIPREKVTEIKNIYEKLAIPTVKNFFLVDATDKDEEDCGVDFEEDEKEVDVDAI